MLYWPSWLEIGGAFFIVILLLPLIPNDRLRYYACYINYVVTVSTVGFCLVPVFLIRPRNPVNLVIAGGILKHLSKFLKIDWDIRGGDVLAKDEYRGSVLTFNHQSIFDVMGLFHMWGVMGKATVIAKQELFWVPPFGPVAWLAGLIYINRNDPKIANKQIQESSKQLFQDKINLCVFPEGTRNKKRDSLLPFKNGAFRVALDSQVAVIPIVISPYYFIESKNKLFKKGKVIISVLDPIETKGLTMADMDTLKTKTHKVMSEEFNRLEEEVKKLEAAQ